MQSVPDERACRHVRLYDAGIFRDHLERGAGSAKSQLQPAVLLTRVRQLKFVYEISSPSPYSRNLGNPEDFDFPGFRLALASYR